MVGDSKDRSERVWLRGWDFEFKCRRHVLARWQVPVIRTSNVPPCFHPNFEFRFCSERLAARINNLSLRKLRLPANFLYFSFNHFYSIFVSRMNLSIIVWKIGENFELELAAIYRRIKVINWKNIKVVFRSKDFALGRGIWFANSALIFGK